MLFLGAKQIESISLPNEPEFTEIHGALSTSIETVN